MVAYKLASEVSDESVDQETHNCINIRSTSDTSFIFQYINIDNVKLSLMNLKRNKSPGLDKIPPKVLKLSADIISPSLTYIFNRSLEGAYIDDWKRARVIPIFKLDDRRSARIIDQFPCFQLLEKCLRKRFFVSYIVIFQTIPYCQTFHQVSAQNT